MSATTRWWLAEVLASTAEVEARIRDEVRPLCERYGYGAVMAAASRLWREVDPDGAISLGECYGVLEAQRRRKNAYGREWMRRKRAAQREGKRHAR